MSDKDREDLRKFAEAVENVKRALLDVVRPLVEPIVAWLAKKLERKNGEE